MEPHRIPEPCALPMGDLDQTTATVPACMYVITTLTLRRHRANARKG